MVAYSTHDDNIFYLNKKAQSKQIRFLNMKIVWAHNSNNPEITLIN